MFGVRVKSERERRATQDSRLVSEDFPWLWAIRREWFHGAYGTGAQYPVAREITVRPVDVELTTLLHAKPKNSSEEFWVHVVAPPDSGCILEKVVKPDYVWFGGSKEVGKIEWAELLRSHVLRPNDVPHLVFVRRADPTLAGYDGEWITIYRQKHYREIADMVFYIAHSLYPQGYKFK